MLLNFLLDIPLNVDPVVPVDTAYHPAFAKMLMTLGGLLLLVFLTLWVLRKLSHGRIGSFGSNKRIKIVERRPLSPKTLLYILDIDGKEVLISESQFEVRHLSNLDKDIH